MENRLFRTIHDTILLPAAEMLPAKLNTREARVMQLAIGAQESRFRTRIQQARGGGIGPARGYWQFERSGGVTGVLKHPASAAMAREVCAIRGVAPQPRAVWTWLGQDDLLGAAFARLLLYTDPRPLPALGNSGEAWDYYLENWKPGAPHPETWGRLYAQALEVVRA